MTKLQPPQTDPPANVAGPTPTTPNHPAHGSRGSLVDAGEPAPPASPRPTPAQRKELSGRLAGLSLPRQVWVLSLWPLLEQVLSFLVGTVDLAIAGRLPEQGGGDAVRIAALDAISIGSYFVWMMLLMQAAVGVGATALVARAVGASHRRLANAGVGQAIVLAFGLSTLAAVVVIALAQPITGLMRLEGQSAAMATTYLRICALSIPLCGVLFVGSACLRAAGDTKSPFFAIVLVNIVNVIASVLLAGVHVNIQGSERVIGLGWGVAGIAAGTTIAWSLGGLMILGILLSGRSGIRLRTHRLRPHAHTMRRIARVGLPNLFEQFAFWGINFAMLYYVAMLGQTGAFGAHTIAMRIESVSFLPAFAIAVAASTLTGQYMGLGTPHRAKAATWMCVGATVGIMSLCGLAFWFIPEQLVALLSPGVKEHLELAPPLLRICAIPQPLLGVFIILSSAMRGAGDTRIPAILSFSVLILFRLIGGYILTIPLGFGLAGIWIAMMADITVRGILFTGYYLTGRWQHAAV